MRTDKVLKGEMIKYKEIELGHVYRTKGYFEYTACEYLRISAPHGIQHSNSHRIDYWDVGLLIHRQNRIHLRGEGGDYKEMP